MQKVGLWIVVSFCKSRYILLFTCVWHCYTAGIIYNQMRNRTAFPEIGDVQNKKQCNATYNQVAYPHQTPSSSKQPIQWWDPTQP